MIARVRNIINFIICIFFLLLTLAPIGLFSTAYAEEKAKGLTVRVGWYESPSFQEGMNNRSEKSGYSYEYLQKIATYTDWKYVYVYGGWTDLFEKLKKGEIDVLAGVSDTVERRPYMNFPQYPMGMDRHFLFQLEKKKVMDAADKTTFIGKKVGGITNNRMTTYLEKWVKDNQLDLTIVLYDNFGARDKDFASSKLDGVVATGNNISLKSGIVPVAQVGEEPFYLAVTKARPDILAELNNALAIINKTNPTLIRDLERESYGSSWDNSTLSANEEAWLIEHKVLRVGYVKDYMPFCGQDEKGQVNGIITTIMDQLIEKLHIEQRLKIQYQAYDDFKAMGDALAAGEIDTSFAVINDRSILNAINLNASSELVTVPFSVAYRGEYSKNTFDVMAQKTRPIKKIKTDYANSKILKVANDKAALEAIQQGKATCTIMASYRLNYLLNDPKYRDIKVMPLSTSCNYSLGVAKNQKALLSLLDKGVFMVDKSMITDQLFKYILGGAKFTVSDFAKEHLGLVATLALLVFGGIIGSLMLYNRSMAKAKQRTEEQLERINSLNSQLEEKQKQLEEAAAEQEAHIEEVTALNSSLEENQVQLEEAVAENEAQLEEITAAKEELEVAQEALEEARYAAEAANEAKTIFLNNMSHDIRTPMNAILGFAHLMEKELDQPEKAAISLRKIKISGNYLLDLINNVLDMARIESGKAILNEEFSDLYSPDMDMIAIFEEEARKKNLTVTKKMNVIHRYIIMDKLKVGQIAMNLMSNAVKYTPEGGSIDVSFYETACEKPGYGTYVLKVSDNGIGMSKDFQETIFDAFTRERNTTQSKIIGTGLGMSVVKKLVDLMGGTIEVESEAGKGTTFIVTISHRIADNPEQYLKQEVETQGADKADFIGKRILLAEDNELNAEIAIAVLENEGFIVEHAEDGVICVDKLNKAEAGYYAAILMDIQMPNLNGYEATKKIRNLADKTKAGIPVLAMTANAFDEDKSKALEAGMDGFCTKPLDIDALNKELARVLK